MRSGRLEGGVMIHVSMSEVYAKINISVKQFAYTIEAWLNVGTMKFESSSVC